MARRDAAHARKMLMIVEVEVEIRLGPLSSPRERGPDLFPRPHAPEVGADITYNDLWPFGGRQSVAIRSFVIVAGKARLHATIVRPGCLRYI